MIQNPFEPAQNKHIKHALLAQYNKNTSYTVYLTKYIVWF